MANIDRTRLDQLLAETDEVFRDAFAQYVANVKSERVINAITERLEAGDIEGAIDIVRSHVVVLGQSVPEAIQIAGAAAAVEAVGELGASSVAFAFDPTNPRAAAIIRNETLGLIREFTDKQIEVTRDALANAFMEGDGTAATARAFRDSIGLTRYYQARVASFRAGLELNSATTLDRKLRDRRFDRTVQRAIESGKPLRREQIDTMVDHYRARQLADRAETIARTESVRATSIAREESFQQLADQTGLKSRMLRIWNSTLDKRTRDWHVTMNGQTRRIGEAFVDGQGNRLMFPGDPNAPARTTINCRCVLTMRIQPAE